MAVLKKYTPTGNPKKIKDLEELQKLQTELNDMKEIKNA